MSSQLIVPLGLACVALFVTGCPAAKCELSSDAYEGADTLPMTDSRAGEVIGALERGGAIDVTWAPPTSARLDDAFPPAPFEGPDVLTVSLEFQDPAFHAEYSYDLDYGRCGAGAPRAEVMLLLDSQDGRLHERVPSVATVEGGQVYVTGPYASSRAQPTRFCPRAPTTTSSSRSS